MTDKDRQEPNADPAERLDRAAREERFLARWSKRKARLRDQEEQDPPAAVATDNTSPSAGSAPLAIADKTDGDMPPIESLEADSDYAQFLSPKVSERLRRAALRKLFHLPQYSVMDGLDTYIADCRYYTPLGDVITADMRHQMERQAQAALARLEEQSTEAAGEKPATPLADAAAGTTEQEPKPADKKTAMDDASPASRAEAGDGKG